MLQGIVVYLRREKSPDSIQCSHDVCFNFTKLVEKAKALSFHNSYVGIIQARRGEVGRKETWKPYAAVYNGCEKDEKSRKQMFHDWGGCDGIVDCPWTCSHVLYYIQERNARRLK